MSIKQCVGVAGVAAVVCLLIFSAGCAKKKGSTKQAVAIPKKAAVSTVAQKTAADSHDIFDEFYNEAEEKQANSSEKKAEEKAVETAAATAPSASSAKLPQFEENGRYAVQVVCVPTQKYAERISAKLEKKGYPAYVAQVENPTPQLMGSYYRVRIKGFSSIGAAKQFGDEFLTNDGYQYWVDNRSNDNVGLGSEGLGNSLAPQSTVTQSSTGFSAPISTEPAPTYDQNSGVNQSFDQPSNSSQPIQASSPIEQPAPASSLFQSEQPAPAVQQPETNPNSNEWSQDTTINNW
ncbi:MAG: SPOR domain-containing protein [Chitinivibrionales bacterium]|nr:SPOR domain-containing protein [Chitinivibrionales bacterium]